MTHFELNSYPSHWWAPISTDSAPEWEILPQAANSGEVILSKRNELGCLSNFAPTPFEFRGKRYASVEGWWQMMFYPENSEDPRACFPGLKWPYSREQVSQMSGFEAWEAGDLGFRNMRSMGINWVTFEGKEMEYWIPTRGEHHDLVVEAMWAKLRQNEIVRETLLATGSLVLRADHYEPKDAPPSWEYYRIWMDIRERLRTGGRHFRFRDQ